MELPSWFYGSLLSQASSRSRSFFSPEHMSPKVGLGRARSTAASRDPPQVGIQFQSTHF